LNDEGKLIRREPVIKVSKRLYVSKGKINNPEYILGAWWIAQKDLDLGRKDYVPKRCISKKTSMV